MPSCHDRTLDKFNLSNPAPGFKLGTAGFSETFLRFLPYYTASHSTTPRFIYSSSTAIEGEAEETGVNILHYNGVPKVCDVFETQL